MTIRDYIGQKLSAYGDLSEADMLDFSIKSGLSPDDEMSSESIGKVETGMIEIIPSLLLRPDSVNESGFSVSWRYYLFLCERNGVSPDVSSGLGVVSSYMDY
mgnify:CR=1 FL=1